jgi:hypothetical protein
MNHRLAEGSLAFICDRKESVFVKIPESGPEKSVLDRKARFTLAEDGSLTGEVVETFTGHEAEMNKERDWQTSQADLEKKLGDSLREHLPDSEISEAHWENLRGAAMPVVLCYKLQVPGYAQKAGPRLIWPLNCFKVGNGPWFPAAERQYAIVFPFQYTEHDDIEIIIPDGYALDHASAPGNVADSGDPIHCTYHLSYTGKRRTLKYERTFVLGRTNFPVADYHWIRAVFNDLNRSDTHSIVLISKSSAATVPR